MVITHLPWSRNSSQLKWLTGWTVLGEYTSQRLLCLKTYCVITRLFLVLFDHIQRTGHISPVGPVKVLGQTQETASRKTVPMQFPGLEKAQAAFDREILLPVPNKTQVTWQDPAFPSPLAATMTSMLPRTWKCSCVPGSLPDPQHEDVNKPLFTQHLLKDIRVQSRVEIPKEASPAVQCPLQRSRIKTKTPAVQ